MIGVDENEPSDTVSRKLLDNRAAGSRTSHHSNPESTQSRVGAGAEGLGDPLAKGLNTSFAIRIPKGEVVSDDVHMRKRFEMTCIIHHATENAAVIHQYRAAVRTAIGPAVDARE
ncbi:hypothetical protein MesoLj131c_69670 (plasmid) [Mesorhizobium sp. 131-3-5]|nr:hypothetical protein MesoLj131c_69670 [Mesorhizobium sp. 131-3-5]